MEARLLLAAARVASGLTQEAVARRAGTTQPTLSAYEHGHRSPTLAVTERILRAMGYELDVIPRISFQELPIDTGRRRFHLPSTLWRLPVERAYAPLPPGRSPTGKTYFMEARLERLSAYVWLLEHADPGALVDHVDGALLVDAWPEIADSLHPTVRRAWAPLITAAEEQWFMDRVTADLAAGRPRRLGRRAPKRILTRLASYGLTREEVEELLRRRRLRG